jgi:tetratricopeptide (TPR) repeat protein
VSRNEEAHKELLPLDLIGIGQATDKSSLIGDYLRHYEKLFWDIRDSEFNFIEIGVFRGGSARTWERFFSRARIVGVDINPDCRRYATDRVKIEIGSQNDPDFLHRLVTTYPPQVIIDDGSHQSYDVIFTFERLFPTLLPGGIYVIEDLHFHLLEADAERLRGGSPVLAHDYVADLVRDRLGNESHTSKLTGIRRYLVESIDRIEIIAQAAFIHKKRVPDRLQLDSVLPHVEASNDWLNWLTYSQKLLQAGEDLPKVADALRRSIDLNAGVLATYDRLSEVLERMKRFGEAISVLESAIAVAKDQPRLVNDLQRRIQRLRNM